MTAILTAINGPNGVGAAYFDGDSYIQSETTTGGASSLFSFSLWFYAPQETFNNYSRMVDFNTATPGGASCAIGFGAGSPPVMKNIVEFDDGTGTFPFVISTNVGPALIPNGWHNLLGSFNVGHDAGFRIANLYLDNVLSTYLENDTGSAFVIDFDSGGTQIPYNQDPVTFSGNLAEVWLAPGVFIDFSNPVNRAKFIDANGNPVALGAHGEIPTGAAPNVYFSGSTATFADNVGTGSSFEVVGKITLGDPTPYIDLVTSEHNQKPKFIDALTAIVQGFADEQVTVTRIPLAFDVDTAVQSQLDIIGQWVGQTRNLPPPLGSLNDMLYRVLLKAKIAANQWDGTIPGAYAAYAILFAGQPYTAFIVDNGDMTMELGIFGDIPPATIIELLTGGFLDLRPAGVGIKDYLIPSVGDVPFFGFDLETSTISGFDVGAWATILPPT